MQLHAPSRFHPEPTNVGRCQRRRQRATRRLPRDVISSILVHVPAIDLRRFRRVCREWRDVIADPTFIRSHMVQGSKAPTHTVVFVPSSSDQQRTGRAFLFNEQWRLTAKFDAGESQVLIGTCNGLLCLHDEIQGVVKVVEPFTGESMAVPAPTDSMCWRSARSYCFGFDAATRHFKIVHKGEPRGQPYIPGVQRRQLQVFTVGADKEWRAVSIASCDSSDDPAAACNGGAVYWSYTDKQDAIPKYARLDLATEEIMPVECRLVDSRPVFCHHPSSQQGHPCVTIIGIRWLVGESDGGYWPPNMNAMALDVDAVNLPLGRRLPRQQALQRGHLLLHEENGALYAHQIVGKSVHGLDLGCEKLLIGIGGVEEEPARSSPAGQFVPVERSRQWTTQQLADDSCEAISTFAYTPTVSPVPLALYVGKIYDR